jgi:hypothetical protein
MSDVTFKPGKCPIHAGRLVLGATQYHACGCGMLDGETQLSDSDVLASLSNLEEVEERANRLANEDHNDDIKNFAPDISEDITANKHKGNAASQLANPKRSKREGDCIKCAAELRLRGPLVLTGKTIADRRGRIRPTANGGGTPEEIWIAVGGKYDTASTGSARCSNLKDSTKGPVRAYETGFYRLNHKGNFAEILVADIYVDSIPKTPTMPDLDDEAEGAAA